MKLIRKYCREEVRDRSTVVVFRQYSLLPREDDRQCQQDDVLRPFHSAGGLYMPLKEAEPSQPTTLVLTMLQWVFLYTELCSPRLSA